MKITHIKRILTVLAIFALLVFVGRTAAAAVAFFAIGLFLALIPVTVLFILTAFLAWLVTLFFNHSKLISTIFFVLLICQAMIQFSWFEGWTAASAFAKHSHGIGLTVIDPQLENKLMIIFWLLAALLVAFIIEHLINSFLSIETNLYNKSSQKAQVGTLLFAAFLLLSLNSNSMNDRRITRDIHIPASISPDGIREAQLVPMDAWIDTNGIVIVRKSRSLLWRTVGDVGDILTDADGGRFVWSNDSSKVYLLLNLSRAEEYPTLGFDFKTNQQISSKSIVGQK
ncbi:MAG: hypothetical protein AUG51_06630 [Acidobacteria bacterium 13_1_20CM_3_53_8]|nr:MAG: hypothetical protein AUG51_06630 [Acidobacteria bacterium 13_1_20CM_3_53_8]